MTPSGTKKIASLCSIILLGSTLLIISSTNPAVAEQDPAGSAGSDQVAAASGSNRFVVWYDGTPGNFEIFFRRSTDNGATWQPAINLSTNPGHSYNPQIAVSGSNVYIIWTQYSSDGSLADVFFRGSTNNGGVWGPKVKISSSGTNFSFFTPRIAASGSNVYITWQDDGAVDVFSRRSTDGGASWKSIQNLSNNADDSFDPQVATSGSNVYVVWYDKTAGNYEILLKRSTDSGATWKAVKNLSNNAGSSFSPQVAVSGSNVYLVWVDQTPGNSDVFFRRSADNGATWQPAVNLSSNPKSSTGPQIAISGSSVYVVWTQRISADEFAVFFRRSTDNGGIWGPKIEISSSGMNVGFPPRVAASGSNVYISWGDDGAADVLFRRSTDSGATWKPIINISNNAGNSRDPQVAASGSNVYLVWVDRTPGNNDILLKRSTDSGATWKAVKNLSNNAGTSDFPQIGV
jgi:hypothetical protein